MSGEKIVRREGTIIGDPVTLELVLSSQEP